MRGKIFENVILLQKTILPSIIKKSSICVDCTVGNGNDSEFLLSLIGNEGFLYGFDIQEIAIEKTKEKLKAYHNYKLILDGHENIKNYIQEEVDFIIFNLGYLPQFSKEIKTTVDTTVKAVKDSLELLKVSGILWIVVYHGHEEGKEESKALEEYLSSVDQKLYAVSKIQMMNQINNPPYILAIEKKGHDDK